jgi:hypothetical protein
LLASYQAIVAVLKEKFLLILGLLILGLLILVFLQSKHCTFASRDGGKILIQEGGNPKGVMATFFVYSQGNDTKDGY